MKIISTKKISLFLLLTAGIYSVSNAQNGSLDISQDEEISNLLKLKKEINTEDNDTNRYKIQIFSGSRERAESMENSFDSSFNSWPSSLVYETPNYKVWVGNFRTRLEADRALMKIKKKFPTGSFIFKPKKKD
ncbi:SPOR domain-containing protein [Lacinutrix sp. 5H-3-7-4]|uniref:SPOR domain-containing protein n=1 Tax=Lacinutrix sp. (strain 5H-3-7-4) TaxID=983544 RepID=UPI00020A3803|nr:SPOR domain-containing protein [Lacinutrix sp. 5H-3-7-4]AEH01210.1 Sporulation domain-containing protein [Lacinutrix sp. 5H-3-7-4]